MSLGFGVDRSQGSLSWWPQCWSGESCKGWGMVLPEHSVLGSCLESCRGTVLLQVCGFLLDPPEQITLSLAILS